MSTRKCDIDGCSDRHYAKGRCQYHYSQMSNKTTEIRSRYKVPSRSALCSAGDCDEKAERWRKAEKAWFCRHHWRRLAKGVSFDAPKRVRNIGDCIVLSCKRKAKSRLMCEAHYARSVKGADLEQPLKVKSYKGARCKIDGCDRVAKSDFMCAAHADRARNGLDLTARPFKRVYRGEACERTDCGKNASSLGLCRRHYAVVRRYGFAALDLVDQYLTHGCPICQRKVLEAGAPCVDHDHSCCAGQSTCGKCVRGAICSQCNAGLGMFQDGVDVLERAMHYLQGNHPAALQRREA